MLAPWKSFPNKGRPVTGLTHAILFLSGSILLLFIFLLSHSLLPLPRILEMTNLIGKCLYNKVLKLLHASKKLRDQVTS